MSRRRKKPLTWTLPENLPIIKTEEDRKYAYTQIQSLPMTIQNILSTLLPGEDGWLDNLIDDLTLTKPHIESKFIAELSQLFEQDGKTVVEAHIDRPFHNWGKTIQTTPMVSFVPRTIVGIQNIVKWVRMAKHTPSLRIRCSGYRHTWNAQFPDSGSHVLISLLPLQVATHIPAASPPMQSQHFQFARIVGTLRNRQRVIEHCLCEFGAATTMEQIRGWCKDKSQGGGQCKWSLPLNVVMGEITIAGAVLAMSHGAGWTNPTLADLVYAINYVDQTGKYVSMQDPQMLLAVAGSFGLMGVVTSIVMKLIPMKYVTLRQQRLPLHRTIPPLNRNQQVARSNKSHQMEFERHCRDDFYCEWFWFPGQQDAWINSFTDDGDPNRVEDFPSNWESLNQWIQSWLSQQMLTSWTMQSGLVDGVTQSKILGEMAMHFLPVTISPNHRSPLPIAYLSDALHFRKGVENTRVRNFEVEIPLYHRDENSNEPEWLICNRAWNDALTVIEEQKQFAPLRISLEMRIMSGSNMILAPQRHNQCGTCAIEVISTLTVEQKVWARFKQALIDKWFNYRDPRTNEFLNVRPHWCKEWIEDDLYVRDETMLEYMLRIYKPCFQEFRSIVWPRTAAENYLFFSNKLFDQFLAPQ